MNRSLRTRVLLIVPVLATILVGCGSQDRLAHPGVRDDPRNPIRVVDRDPSKVYAENSTRGASTTLRHLVAASTLVVEGTVTGITPGIAPPANAHPSYGIIRVELSVGRLLRGSGAGGKIFFEQLATVDGKVLDLSGMRVAKQGDRGIYFLAPFAARPGTFELYNNQAQYIDIGSGLTGSDPSDGLVQELNSKSLDQLVNEIASLA